tara:strand:- start:1608 stop:2861 length:1254 start_codon:yes stop_codon:yes gene_type:complete
MNQAVNQKFSKEVKSWIAYDAGNSAFATTVLAAFFPLFFSSYWAGGVDEITATKYYTAGLTVINLVILLGMPIIGAITDVKNLTKSFFAIFTIIGAVFVTSFYFIEQNSWLIALILYGIALFCFSAAIVLYDKILVYVAKPSDISKVSGYGYAIGYLGGGTLFVINAFMVMNPSFFGLENNVSAIKWSFVTVGVWWIIFSLPLVLNYKQPRVEEQRLSKSFNQILTTFKEISSQKNVVIFLIAFFLYIDGVHTVMSLAAMFGDGVGIGQESIITALIIVQFVAAPLTFMWSLIANKYGDKKVIYATISIYIVVVIYSMSLSTATEFYILAIMVGSVQGGIQAASRSLFAKIIPKEKSGEFFGFYNTFGRAGSVIGPLLVNVFLVAFNDLKIALVPLIILFILGIIFLYFVDEKNELV